MKLSQTTNKDGILQRAEALCSLGDGGITNDTTLTKQFIGYVNAAYHEIWMAQMDVDGNAKSDDYNYTDLPDAPITMVTSQADYTIPVAVSGGNVASFLRLNGVYFIYGGVRTYLTLMTDEDTLTTTDGEPTKYRINGKSITFQCPLSAATLTRYSSVFHVEFQRVPDAFAYADLDGSKESVQQPGFMETYHDLLPLKASSSYLLPINPQLSQLYENRFITRLELFKRDTARLNDNAPKRLTPHYENNR